MLVRTKSMVHVHMAAALAAGITPSHVCHSQGAPELNQNQRHLAACLHLPADSWI